MPDSFRRRELLTWLEPFHVGSGRQPAAEEMNQIRTLIRALATENPIPNVAAAFSRIAGMWKCIFTTSRFVLGLDHLRIVRLSAVYQNVVVHPGGKTGHYFNIAEMSRGTVRTVCGEYASIQPSGTKPSRLDVQYQWFYLAVRVFSSYEGQESLSHALETDRVPRSIRLPFRKPGWQSIKYLDERLRIVCGNEGGMFVMVREGE